MNRAVATVFAVCFLSSAVSQSLAQADESLTEEILGLERAALDRWLTGDPGGYLELYAPEITYFDPSTERRVDGLDTIRARFTRPNDADTSAAGSPAAPRYELVNTDIQRYGDIVVLSFNFVSYQDDPRSSRWNATEVYRLIEGEWRITHSHWSLTTPELAGIP
jgi:ketosteroid isomerase-like protein